MTVTGNEDPFELFGRWMDAASAAEPKEANAVALATADQDGRPSVRMVLLKGFDPDGFVFYTNLGSRKCRDLAANPFAALCFHWKSTNQQIRIEGAVDAVSDAEADAYFASRHRSSRIGAWASKQSQPLTSRFELEKRVAAFTAQFHVGPVPRPEFWSGFRLRPDRFEFWQDQAFRLHDRMVFERDGDAWRTHRVFP